MSYLRTWLTVFVATGFFSTLMARPDQKSMKDPAGIMSELRLKMLTNSPTELGLKPTTEYPHVCGVVMDWPIQNTTVTVVSLATGDASIYTTGTFGVIGGIGHEKVRVAARECVTRAQALHSDAKAVKEYPYPDKGHVRFYLICYDGVRVLDAPLDRVAQGLDKTSALWNAGQRVVTELRLITQDQKGGK